MALTEAEAANFDYLFPHLWNLIDTARANKIAKPQLHLGRFKFKYAPAKDCIYISIGNWDNNIYYGKITRKSFWGAENNSIIDNREITELASDPGTAAKAYGMKTGTCCVCGRVLVNKESVRLMIGPICLEKYGFSPVELVATEEEDGQIRLEDI